MSYIISYYLRTSHRPRNVVNLLFVESICRYTYISYYVKCVVRINCWIWSSIKVDRPIIPTEKREYDTTYMYTIHVSYCLFRQSNIWNQELNSSFTSLLILFIYSGSIKQPTRYSPQLSCIIVYIHFFQLN